MWPAVWKGRRRDSIVTQGFKEPGSTIYQKHRLLFQEILAYHEYLASIRQRRITPTFPKELPCPLPLPGRQVPFQR